LLLTSASLLSDRDNALKVYLILIILVIILIFDILFWNKSLHKAIKARTVQLDKDALIQKQMELEIRKRQRQFELIFEAAPVGIAIRDLQNEGRLIDVNQAYADMLGYSRNELKEGAFDNIAYQSDLNRSEAVFNKILAEDGQGRIEKRLVKKDGSLIYIDQRLVIIRDDNNIPLLLIGMSLDITEHVKTLEKLRDNDNFYKSVLHNMAGIVYNCKFDENWTMTYMSSGVLSMTGFPASDFINNKNNTFLSIILPEDRQRVAEIVNQAVGEHRSYHLEYRIIHKNGELIWVYEEGRGIYDDNDNLLYLNGTIININKRKQAEIKQKQIEKNLEDLVKLRTRDLEEKNKKLEEVNSIFAGRELRINNLSNHVKKLKQELSKLSR
jgi:PAS domain S-box-containing protein